MGNSISKKIIKNTLWNTIGYGANFIIALFLTPYIIRYIGVERYGIWALFFVLMGYFGLFDFGIGGAFSKYIAEFYTKKDIKTINRIVNTGLVFYIILAVFVIFLTFLFINPLIKILKIPVNLHLEAKFTFILGITIFAISNIFKPFGDIQNGLQRMDVSNKIAISLAFIQVLVTIFFLKNGYGLLGLIFNNVIILLLGSFVNIIVAFKILPGLQLTLFLYDKNIFKKLFNLGYKIQITKVAGWFQEHLNKVFLSHFLQIGYVTYYTVALNLVIKIQSIPLLLTSAVMPAASELDTMRNKKSLQILYFRSMKYTAMIVIPFAVAIILFAKPFINLWIGKEFEKSILTLQILGIAYLFNALTSPGFFILNGMGKAQYAMWSAIIAVVSHLCLSIILLIKIGYLGVVIGTFISFTISTIYFLYKANQIMEVFISEIFIKIFLKPLISCFMLFVLFNFLITKISLDNWFIFISICFLYLLLFAIIMLIIGYLDDFDKMLFNKYIPKFFEIRR